jgi:glutathione peroxidase
MNIKSFYDLSVKTPRGETVSMSEYKGKVVLVVNTATKCGLAPQFEGLEKLHEKYKDKGLVVLGFPCDQFRNQEPETNETMEEACRINHGVTFQLFEKILVNGKDTHPVFSYLKSSLGSIFGKKIKWNFTKFLIDTNGKPIKRFSPVTPPEKIEKDIEALLKKPF